MFFLIIARFFFVFLVIIVGISKSNSYLFWKIFQMILFLENKASNFTISYIIHFKVTFTICF